MSISTQTRPLTNFRSSSLDRLAELLRTQLRVIYAVMMHDIKARYFGTGLGYVFTVLWPSAHLAVVVAIYFFRGQRTPYGDSQLLYVATGVLPFIIWNYISRFTILSVIQNKSFLQYPLVSTFDLIIGRQALELVTGSIITFGLIIFLTACGIDPMPHRLEQAAFALFSATLLGMGFGILAGVIVMIFPFFHIVYVGIAILTWATSGVVIDPETLPTPIANILAWNPLVHSIEWLRLAYYDDYPARLLDKAYVLYCGAGSFSIGLVAERVLRVFTMQ